MNPFILLSGFRWYEKLHEADKLGAGFQGEEWGGVASFPSQFGWAMLCWPFRPKK
jgi:hypothetical protein